MLVSVRKNQYFNRYVVKKYNVSPVYEDKNNKFTKLIEESTSRHWLNLEIKL